MPAGQNKDERSPELMSLNTKPGAVITASVWGMSAPWSLALSALIGIMLIVLPKLFQIPIQASLSDTNHLCGALVVVVAIISMGEVVRAGRYLNVLLGLAVAVLPWLLADGYTAFKIVDTVAGLAVAALAVPRGIKKEQYGLWDKYVV
jgi:hypothetical protein